jgi:geranylgeranyl diphosphate synthase type II
LIAAALKIGAIAAKAPKEELNRIYDFGILIGLAFQLRDDFLDAFGNVDTFGKPIGNDIITNKKTYLYLKAYELAKDGMRTKLDAAFALTINEQKVKAVLDIYAELDIRKHTEDKIIELYDKGLELLNKVNRPENEKKEMYAFLKKLVKREV